MILACESLNFCAEDDGNAVQIFVGSLGTKFLARPQIS